MALRVEVPIPDIRPKLTITNTAILVLSHTRIPSRFSKEYKHIPIILIWSPLMLRI